MKEVDWRAQSYGNITGGDFEQWLLVFQNVWNERGDFTSIKNNPDLWFHSFEKISEIPSWVALYELDLLRLIGELLAHSGIAEEFMAAAKTGPQSFFDLVQTLPTRAAPDGKALPASMAMLGNLEAIAVYSRSINDMIKAAKSGDFEALGEAASIDAYVLMFPFFLAGMRVDQLSGEKEFTKEVFRTVSGPHRRRYDYVNLRWAEYLLRDQGAFEACSREDIYVLLVEHLKLYDPTGTRKDPKAALFAMFKKWQKQAGIQNPRFGFSGKKKA